MENIEDDIAFLRSVSDMRGFLGPEVTKKFSRIADSLEELQKLKAVMPGKTVFYPTVEEIVEMPVTFICDHEGGVGVYGHPVGGVGGTTVKLSHVWTSRKELEEYLEREAYESDPRNQPIE